MIVKRITAEGIAHHSYFIGSDGSAAVIDPRRDCQIYLDLSQRHEMNIRYILETHRNEDYAIGSIELKDRTAAEIFHGPGLDWGYGTTLKDGQEFSLGDIKITTIHTPGHTDESVSYAVTDLATGDAPVMVFSGDCLLVGDTGRIDLYGPQEAPRMAANLYDSIFKKILPLGDGVILCPGHGGGSVCGSHIASREDSTIGIEKAQNPLLRLGRKEDFVRAKLAERPERPPYFRQMEKYNREGPPLLGCVPLPAPLTPGEFMTEMDAGAVAVDTSEVAAFGGIHLRGAYNIWLKGLPAFAGWVLPYHQPILLVLEDQGHLDRAVRYLMRAGYDRIAGYLRNGVESWYNAGLPLGNLPLLAVHQLKSMLDSRDELLVLDTRSDEEWNSGHIEGALHIYAGQLEQRLAEVPKDKPIAVYCGTGHRASLAASILLRAGYPKVYNVPGGMTAWVAAGFPVIIERVQSSPERHAPLEPVRPEP